MVMPYKIEIKGRCMKKNVVNKNIMQFAVVTVATLGMFLFVSITPGYGQKDFEAKRSETIEGLVDTGYMTKADVSDYLDGGDDEYFYKFIAGPGKLTVTLEVLAAGTNAGAYLDLFTTRQANIMSNVLAQGINGGNDRVSKNLQLLKKQEIIIRVKGVRYGSSGGTGEYKVTIGGTAVKFEVEKVIAPAPAPQN